MPRPSLLVTALLVAGTLHAAPPLGLADYQRMLEWRVAATPVPVPPEGLRWEVDAGRFELESGELFPLEPLADGATTGFVFEGKGRFRLDVPDPVEVAQLRRFSGKDDLDGVDTTFRHLVVRTADRALLARLVPSLPEGGWKRSRELRKVMERWLKRSRWNVDARVLSALLDPGDHYFFADFDSSGLGRLGFEDDASQVEEIQLSQQRSGDITEIWVSLDRDRGPDGRPRPILHSALDQLSADIDVDLRERSWRGDVGLSRTRTRYARFDATLALRPLHAGARVALFELDPHVELQAVTDAEGRELPFIRDALGERFATVDRRTWDRRIEVLLPEPTETSQTLEISFRYQMDDFAGYVSGRDWYPGTPDALNDLHAVELEALLPPELDLRAVGAETAREKEGDGLRVTWRTRRDVKMFAFTVGRDFREEKIAVDGDPTVIGFGDDVGLASGDMLHSVTADVANSLQLFERLFDERLPSDTLWATRITGWHGQAFDGFLHLGEPTFASESRGASELFRAHEVAHEYWGNLVGWFSYRDQWLSEGFAEYSALLYVENQLPASGLFDEILDVYTAQLLGSHRGMMSRFARPWSIVTPNERAHLGPIGVGWRASRAEVPSGYYTEVYVKGAVVLHMLRMLLRSEGGDELFFRVLARFIDENRGRAATTADFRHTVEELTHRDWKWFFDEWVDGTAIPTYRWSERFRTDGPKGPTVELHVRESGVPDDFRMPLLVRLEIPEGAPVFALVPVDGPEKDFELPVPAKPERIEVGWGHEVLAHVDED